VLGCARFLIWPNRRKRLNDYGFIAAAKPNWWYGDLSIVTSDRASYVVDLAHT
jgi:hypothetical protein